VSNHDPPSLQELATERHFLHSISIILVACFNGCPWPQARCFAAAVKLGRWDSVHQSMPTWLWRNFHSSLQSDRSNGYYSVACTHHLVACHTLWASHHSPSRQSALSLGSSACVQYSHPCWYISNSSHCNLEPSSGSVGIARIQELIWVLCSCRVCCICGIGEWWTQDTEEVERTALRTGGAPTKSDAITINGMPGPLYNHSAGTH
jgi:hypothetical protein